MWEALMITLRQSLIFVLLTCFIPTAAPVVSGMMCSGSLPSGKPLPDASSQGAKLVGKYCVQCHAAPQPSFHTADEWSVVTQRMQQGMNSEIEGMKAPTEQEMKEILSYLQKNAPEIARK